ncbi:hypothetical protein [uncultured Hoeflea sp.]|uniref:hypothetical protein n=1 Tax=uncultured Hoeflea sp. TaxID=538666 RepID=UPI002630CBCB|nr:hypothetical protein [uncultured Hoeflea sp.]
MFEDFLIGPLSLEGIERFLIFKAFETAAPYFPFSESERYSALCANTLFAKGDLM